MTMRLIVKGRYLFLGIERGEGIYGNANVQKEHGRNILNS